MSISSNIEFVKEFAKEHTFFVCQSQLYLVHNNQVLKYHSDKTKHIVNVEYQNQLNKLAPSNNYLMDNIESRVLAEELITYDTLYRRVMRIDNGIAYDLVEDNQVVVITKDGYQIQDKISSNMLNLLPSNVTKSQVVPVKSDESLTDLIESLTNFESKDDLLLFTVWLVSLLIPDLGSPILILLGEQGSGKSFTSEIAKRIIDPTTIGKQHSLKCVQDFAILVSQSYMSIIDNLSRVTDEMSDAMCQTVSNGQFTTRKLYTTEDVSTIDMKAKLIINGITIMNTKPDLLERSIVIHLEKLNQANIIEEEALIKKLEDTLPNILNHIFLAVSHVVDKIDSVQISIKPRMADFARYATVIADYIGITQSDILGAYERNIKDVNDLIIDDPVIQALFGVLSSKQNKFVGTATELLSLMTELEYKDLPKAANSLSAKLTRLTSDLSKESITIKRTKDQTGNRLLEITRSTAIQR